MYMYTSGHTNMYKYRYTYSSKRVMSYSSQILLPSENFRL